jgi:16S rRNA (adenine1518-N6/adenine1519-N6)-dimethyltransferase
LKLYDPGTLKQFLKRHGLSATKGLGQHFLCSGPVVLKIVDAMNGLPGVLEIGPGPGVLTSPLSEQAERLIALELDSTMISALGESAPKADVRQQDALKANLDEILRELPEPRGVVSNLPYYITGPLLTRIAESRSQFSKAVLMMQKEVAQRVTAGAGSSDRGSLSVYLQSQFEIRAIADAPAGAFVPPPKVDSRVLEFVPRETGMDDKTEPQFFRLVRLGFGQPRKTLVNNLVAGLRISRDEAVSMVEEAELTENARPQELDLASWISLAVISLERSANEQNRSD